jgi:hypothetical protein
MVVYLGVV